MIDDSPRLDRRHQLRHQLIFLGIAVAILVLAFSLRIDQTGRVVVPVVDVRLPESCTFRRLSGVDCAGCGMTRSMIVLADGDWRRAVRYHTLGIPLFLLIVGQVPFRSWQIARIRRGQAPVEWNWFNWIVWLFILVLALHWVARSLGWLVATDLVS